MADLRVQRPEQAFEPYDPTLGHGPWGVRQVAHLLSRAVGGAKPGQVDTLLHAGPFKSLDFVFQPDQEVLEAAWMGIGEPLAAAQDREKLAAWWLMKLVQDDRVTGSRLALFWHNHFATAWSKVKNGEMMFRQHVLFLEKGAGLFADLLHGIVRDPAMLRFLDNDSNRRGLPNENLARELFELFSLGVGHYTEHDIREAARALTGRTVRKGVYEFVALHHDSKAKTVFGQEIHDGDDLVQLLLSQSACPRFLIQKFWRFYVAEEIQPAWLDYLAEKWRENALDVTWLLRTLLGSRIFHDARMVGALVKSPVDFVIGTMRALGGRPDPRMLEQASARMGQALLEPPGVQGWKGGDAWIHTASWLERTKFAADVAAGKHEYLRKSPLDQLFPPSRRSSAATALEDLLRALLPVGLLPSRQRSLLATLESIQVSTPDQRFQKMAYAILCLPEYHMS